MSATAVQRKQAKGESPKAPKGGRRGLEGNRNAIPKQGDAAAVGAIQTSAIQKTLMAFGYRVARNGLAASLALNALFGVIIWVLITQPPPEPRYFATSTAGTITPLVPLSRPNLTDEALRNWVASCVSRAWTFGHHDYAMRIEDAGNACFTREGKIALKNALVQSRTIADMEEYRQVMTTTVVGTPLVLDQGQQGNRAAWRIKVPVLVDKRGERSRPDTQQRNLIITAVRTPTVEHDKGVAISQFVFE